MYEPREDSRILERYVKKLSFGKVLDIGTGAGIQAEAAIKNKEVKSVLATDVDKGIVKKLKNKKFKVIYSDLFSNIKGKFDAIIFNPPYLPNSKYDDDKSLGGGKKGYEVLVRFLNQVSDYLSKEGIILIVFSSITNRRFIDKTIKEDLLNYELLEKNRIFFEELYVYKIFKTKLLKKLEDKKISNIRFFMKGHRGIIFTGKYKNKKITVKIKRPESKAIRRIENEAKFLKILNKHNIGPKLFFSTKDYFIYEFIPGKFILDYFEKESGHEILKILREAAKQMYVMDRLHINKEEMHHPVKHIIVNKNKAVLLDFERCHFTKKPHNLTQFVQFILSLSGLSKEKGITINKRRFIEFSKCYKKDYSEKNLKSIIELLSC